MASSRLCVKGCSLVLKRNAAEGIVLLCVVHRSEFGSEIQVQFVAAHVILQGADIKSPLISIASLIDYCRDFLMRS